MSYFFKICYTENSGKFSELLVERYKFNLCISKMK